MNLYDFFQNHDISIIAGLRGSGKSTLSKYLINLLYKNYDYVIIIDPLHEYDIKLQNTITLKIDLTKDVQYIFSKIYNKMLKVNKRVLLVIDEADLIFKNRSSLNYEQKHAIHYSRHYNISIIVITRRFANLHTDLVSESSNFFMFKLISSADLETLRSMGLSFLINEMVKLKKYEFLIYSIYSEKIYKHKLNL